MTLKTLLILILIIVIVTVGVLYILFFRNAGDQTAVDTTQRRTFSPFGLFSGDSTDEDIDRGQQPTPQDQDTAVEIDPNTARKLVSSPVAGATFVVNKGELAVRYVDRETGHIEDVFATSSKSSRVSNTTVPRIQNVVWGSSDILALQYLTEGDRNVETFLAKIVQTSATTSNSVGSLSGTFLPQNIIGLDFNNNGSLLFYLSESSDGGSNGTIHSTLTPSSPEKTTFSSTLHDLLPEWGREQTITLNTKPSFGMPGQLFTLSASTGAINHKLKDIPALITNTSPDAQYIALTSTRDGFYLSLYDTQTDQKIKTNLKTLPEKCVWSQESTSLYCAVPSSLVGTQPDSWYQGVNNFTDSLFRISLDGSAEPLSAFFAKAVDITNPAVSDDDNYIIFINKRDLSLWIAPIL